MKNSQEKKPENKTKAEVKRCPFDKDIKCEDCRLYQNFSKDIGKVCSINFIAMRSN